MRRCIIKRKVFLYIGLVFTLLAASVVGIYFYTLHRYSDHIAELFDLLLIEDLLDEELPGNPHGNPGQVNTPGGFPHGDEQISGRKSPEDESPPEEVPPEEERPAGERKELDPSLQPAIPAAPNETKNTSKLPAELEELEQKMPLLRNVELKDQVFALQMVKKFSTAEMQEMYRLYIEGGESRILLKKKLEEKITPAEMDRIKAIAAKYSELM